MLKQGLELVWPCALVGVGTRKEAAGPAWQRGGHAARRSQILDETIPEPDLTRMLLCASCVSL